MRSSRSIPFQLKNKLNNELEPGERITWSSMPIPRFFTPAATRSFLFGIPWTAFALFWTASAASFEIPNFTHPISFFPLFGIPFIFAGIGMLSAPYIAYRKALKTLYAITDRRAITYEGGIKTTIRTYEPRQLGDLYRKEKKDGSGDVIIQQRTWQDSEGGNQSEELGFLRITNPKEVEKLLRELAKTAQPVHVNNP